MASAIQSGHPTTSPRSPLMETLAANSTNSVMNAAASEAIAASASQLPPAPSTFGATSPPTDLNLRDNSLSDTITNPAHNHDRQVSHAIQAQTVHGASGSSGPNVSSINSQSSETYPRIHQSQNEYPAASSSTAEAKSPNSGHVGQVCSNCNTTRTPLWRRAPDGQTICNACGLYLKARNTQRPMSLKRQTGGSTLNQTQTGAGATYVAVDVTEGSCPGGGKCNGTGGAEGCNGCPAYNNRVAKSATLGTGTSSPGAPVHPGPIQSSPSPSPSGAARTEHPQSANTTVVVACQNCGTTITPLWRRDEMGNTICNACGLYHKLHGVHRPEAMKKTIIKRRKRVVAPQNGPFASVKQNTTAASPTAPSSATATAIVAPIPATSQATQAVTLHQLAQHIVGGSDDDTEMGDSGSTSGAGSRQPPVNNGSSSTFNPHFLPIDFTSSSSSSSSYRSHSIPSRANRAPMAPMSDSSAYCEDATLAPLQLNHAEPGPSSSSHQNSPRKRSLSVSSGGENGDDPSINTQRLHSINSILNPRSSSSTNLDIPIEPSLLGLNSPSTSQSTSQEEQRIKLLREKRLRLENDQRKLREEMEALDKELATVSSSISSETPGGSSNGLNEATSDLIVRALQNGQDTVDRGGVGDGGGGRAGASSNSNINGSDRDDPMILT